MEILNNVNVGMLEQVTREAESDAPRERLEEAEKLAYERCPAVFALTEQVKLNTSLEVGK